MSDEIFLDGIRFVSTLDAARTSDLSRDYITRLCKRGEVRGRMFGKTWYVDSNSFKEFLSQRDFHKLHKKETLARARQIEYATWSERHTRANEGTMGREQSFDVRAALASSVQKNAVRVARHAHHVTHTPLYTVTPFVDFLHKAVALITAFMLTFGTYAFVDPSYAQSVSRAFSNAARAALAFDWSAPLRDTENALALFAADPKESLAAAGVGISTGSLAELALRFNSFVNGAAYHIAFPTGFVWDGSARDAGVLSVRITERVPASTTTHIPVSTNPQNSTRVVERIVEPHYFTSSQGVSEAFLEGKLSDLESRLQARLSGMSAANSSYVTSNSNAMWIASRNIENIDDSNISNSDWTGGTITNAAIEALSLSVTGTGTSTFAGGINLTSGCFAVNGTCITGGGGGGLSFDYPFPSNATSTKLTFSGGLLSTASTTIGNGTASGGLTISGGATTTGNTYFGASIRVGGSGNISLDSGSYLYVINSGTLNLGDSNDAVNIAGDRFYVGTDNNVGIGTTSPYARLSVVGQVVGSYFTATSTTATSTFAAGLQTTALNVTSTSATSTFANGITLSGGCVEVNGACLGLGSGASFSYPFPSNATTTALTFTNGLLSTASTTIGNGTQVGGLTISGGATTTGDFLISKASAPTTGSLYFGNGTPNVTYNGSDFMFTGGNVYTAANSITAQAASSVLGLGARYQASTGTYWFGASNSATPDLILSNNAGTERARLTDAGFLGIGTTSPYAKLSVVGQTVSEYFTATSTQTASVFPYASTTALTVSGQASTSALIASNSFTFRNVTGFLKATAGAVATAAIDLAADITGILPVANGGTGASSFGQGWLYSSGGTGALAASTSPTVNYLTATSTTATSTFAGGVAALTNKFVVQQTSGRVGIGTASPSTGFDVDVATDISGDLTISGGSALTISASGPINQTGTGQVTFAGNVDATSGLDVTNSNFTVGSTNFIVAPGTGNTTIAGRLDLAGGLFASSTLQVDGASRFYSTLRADGAITAAGSGTGLSVTNNASIGGTLALTGAATFGSSLAVTSTLSAATTTLSGELQLSTKKITGVASPTDNSDAANKSYVDSVAQGLELKQSVQAGTTANITLSGEQTVDGVSLEAGDRVLVKDQTDATKNGIYVVSSGLWTRATDADANDEVGAGMFTFIQDGTVNANSGWVLTTADPITLETSLLTFTQFSGAGQIVAGGGLTKSGNTLDVVGTGNRITVNADSIDIASTYVGQTSITTVGTLTAGALGPGFGNINIGASSITGGAASFSSIEGSAITGSGNLSINGTGNFTGNVTISGTLSAATTTFSGDVALGGKKITGLADPTSAQEAATKAYVDAIAQGLDVKASVRAATTTNVTLSGEQTIDGIALSAGNRVILLGQTDATENGIYVVAAGAWARSADANENSEVTQGLYAFVEEGTENANTGWTLITSGSITLGSTELEFTQFSGSSEITAGDGLTKTGNTLNVAGTANRISVTADAVDIASTYVGQSSITTVGALTAGSIGSGFGSINVGASSITGGTGTFSSLVNYGTLSIGGTATTTIQGNSATSTFSGGIALASGNVNLATGGVFLINNAAVLNATTLGSSVVNSSLTAVGALDSGSITTGFGAINIGSDTLNAGASTLLSLTAPNATTTNLYVTSLTSALSLFDANGQATEYAGSSCTNQFVRSLNGAGVATCASIQDEDLNLSDITLADFTNDADFVKWANATSSLWRSTGLISSASSTIGDGTQTGGLTISGGATTTGNAYFAANIGIGTTTPAYPLSITNAFPTGRSAAISINDSNGLSTNDALLIDFRSGASIGKFGAEFIGGSKSAFVFRDLYNDGATSKEIARIQGDGLFGLGTTTPFAKLSLHALDGETNASLFAIASSTASATTTLFSISNTGILTSSASATSTFAAGIQTTYLNVTGTSATSTFANGINLSGGCFAVNGTCVGGGGGSSLFTDGGASTYLTSLTDNLAVGTSTAYAKLTVWGAGTGTGTLFELANSASTTIAKFLDNGTGYFLGNIGIGTTTPYAKLSLTDAVSTAQVAIAYDSTRYTNLLTNSVGDLIINPQGDDAFLNDDNFWVCTGGSCPSSNPTGTGNLVVENKLAIGTTTPDSKLVIETQDATTDFLRVASSTGQSLLVFDERGYLGIGTSTPTQQLSIAQKLFVGNGTPASAGTATSTFLGDVLITGKLDVSTIDPVYTIDGVKYATYGHSTIGVKEELAMLVDAAEKNTEGKYEYVMNFKNLPLGSDPWLFWQVSNFGTSWENLVVSLTPGFEGQVSYVKDVQKGELRVIASAPGEVSLRLIADRFDASEWPTLRPDQGEGFKGFELKSKK